MEHLTWTTEAVEEIAGVLGALASDRSEPSLEELMAGFGPEVSSQARARLRQSHRHVREEVSALRQRQARSREVHEATGELVALHDVDVVLKAITTRARRLLECDYVYLNTAVSELEATFAIRAWSGALSPNFLGIQVSASQGVGGIVLQTGEPFQVDDYRASTEFAHAEDYDAKFAEAGIATLLAVPLVVAGRTTGILFAARQAQQRFAEDDVVVLTALADHAAIALQNAEMNESRRRALDELSWAVADSEQKRDAAARGARLHVALSSIVLRAGTTAEILDVARAEIGLGMVFVDRTRTTSRIITSGAVGDLPDLSTFYAGGEAGLTPTVRYVSAAKRRWAVVEVAAGARLLGHLVAPAPPRADLGDDVSSLLERCGQAALSQLSTQALIDADRRTAAELVRALVHSPQELPHELARRAQRSGIGSAGPIMVIADTTDPGAVHVATDWTADFGGLAAVLDEVLVILGPADRLVEIDRLATAIARTTTSPNAVLGRARRSLGATPEEYREVRRALNLARALGYAGATLDVEQFGVFSLLFTEPTTHDLDRFVHVHIGPLLDFDRRHDADLAATGLALLEHNLSLKGAATRLGVHPNTVTQRARRIDTLIPADWRVQPRAFEVLAALKLAALRQHLDDRPIQPGAALR
jgi:hypothetical protein